MMNVIKRIKQDERGNAIILAAISLMALLTIAGMAIDGGLVYMTKSHLQKTANAAVLSGAQELTNQEAAVAKVVDEVLIAHKEPASLESISIDMNKEVSVDLSKKVKLAFATLLGFDTLDVKVHASAGLRNMGRAVGAVPLGIDESIQLDFYKTYELKVDSGGVEYGNFGILALGGPGAATYEDNFRNGYKSELKIGDILDTQTGNVAGNTRLVVQERVNGCTSIPPDFTDRDCSRIILVPVYKPYDYIGGQMKQIKVTGFAYFYITDPMDSKDTSIKGMFIRRTGTGFEEPGSKDKGAYSIRLTE